jgi:glyoxylate reductase
MANVFITQQWPGQAVQQLEQAGHTVKVWELPSPPPPEEFKRLLATADGVLTKVTDRIANEFYAEFPRLRVISNGGVGYDNVDLSAAADAGVWITNTPGVLAETSADFAFAHLMASARNIVRSDRDTRTGGWAGWSPTGFAGQDVWGATLGIVGLGEIGQAMARRGRGFNMRVLYNSRSRKPEVESALGIEWSELPDLLRESDFVSLHMALNAESRHMIGAAQFALMKPTAYLINTARGNVVDQDALIAALHEGRIGGASLDVADPEPLPLSNPLFSFPNVVITPHIASASIATRSRMAEIAAGNIIDVLAGRTPLTPVNHPPHPR